MKPARVILAVLLSLAVLGGLAFWSGMQEARRSAPDSEGAGAGPPELPDHRAINEWLTSWSERQAASVQETCEQEPGCDPSQYDPEARPATSFGWSGASEISPTADWARGPRYHVTANGRRLLLYLEDGEVVNATLFLDDGGRRVLCRDDVC